MGDISFFGGAAGGSGGGSGVSNYNELANRPVINISGNPVILSDLPTGVYNIAGTWTMAQGADIFDSPEDDLFYITNGSAGTKVTRVSAEGIYTITRADGAAPEEVVYDTVATVSEAAEQIKEEMWGEL